MNNQNEVELETISRAALIAKYEALTRLRENKDFQVLISEGYLKEEPIRVTSLLAVPSMGQFRSSLFETLAAVSHFEQYLIMIENLGAPAIDDLESDEDQE